MWVSCVKAFPTVFMTVPWLMLLAIRGRQVVPTRRAIASLALAATFAQLGGNVLFQVALGGIGIALTVPLTLGAMIVTGAILGRFVLQEQITWRSLFSMLVLISSIVVLSVGAGTAQESLNNLQGLQAGNELRVIKGVASSIVAGFSYALLGTVIRKNVSGRVRLPAALFIVSVVGAVGLGAMSLCRIGIAGIEATEPIDWQLMILAGLCNAVAFLSLTKSLQLTGVVHVNALNASQVAMAAIAGLLIFDEPLTVALASGVFMTGIGLLLMKRKRPQGSTK